MKRFTNFFVQKEAKKANQLILSAIVAFIICVVFAIWGNSKIEEAKKDMIDMHSLILKKDDRENKMTYLNAASSPYKFAVYEDTSDAYYFVSDGNYLYVVYMGIGDSVRLDKEDIKEKPIKVSGLSRLVTKDIKKIAIDVYNETIEKEEEKLTLADYDNYFGDIYLDLTSSDTSVADLQYMIVFISGFTGIILIIVGVIQRVRFSKSVKKLDESLVIELDNEMNDPESFYYGRARLYLTKNYVINFNGKFRAIKYSDILWMYTFEQRVNGIKSSKAIKILTNDGKTHMIASVDAITKKSNAVFEEIWETIANKNKDMLVGYTQENINAMKEKVKEIKTNR